jgi:hypothetical protein
VRVLMRRGGRDQVGVVQPEQVDVFVHERHADMAALQGRRRNGVDRPGPAGVASASRMMREGGRCGQQRGNGCYGCDLNEHDTPPIAQARPQGAGRT